MTEALLKVRDIVKSFPLKKTKLFETQRFAWAVQGVSFSLSQGEVFGLVGESGCGKTTLGRAILRLVEPTAGSVSFDGQEVTKLNRAGLKAYRRNAQMIFQNPLSSLNPRMSVGAILEEPLQIHSLGTPRERLQVVGRLLDTVGLASNAKNRFPHEFSGGQRQRIGIARALTLQPKLIVADEPVSALDVSIQAQIINLLVRLQKDLNLSLIFISHDLSVVRHIADRVGIMYLGQLVESASADIISGGALHPYTQALISSVPKPHPNRSQQRTVLTGDVPSPEKPPPGCIFQTRCPQVQPICRTEIPPMKKTAPEHYVHCHLWT